MDRRTIQGRAEAELADVGEYAFALPAGARPSGSADALVTMAGPWAAPETTARLSGRNLEVGGQRFESWTARLRSIGRQIHIEQFELVQPAGRLAATGSYDLGTGAYRVQAEGRDLSLAPVPIDPADRPIDVRGRVGFELSGAGSLGQPQGRGRIDATELTVNGYRLGGVRAEATLERSLVTVTAELVDFEARGSATVNLGDASSFSLDAVAERLDLAALVARAPRAPRVAVAGTVALSAHASGLLDRPAEADVTIDLARLDATLDDVPFRLLGPTSLRCAADQVAVSDLRLAVGDTRVQARGRIGRSGAGTLTVSADGQMADVERLARLFTSVGGVELPAFDITGAVEANLRATGTLDRPAVSGELSVTDGTLQTADLPAVTGITVQAAYEAGQLDPARLEATWQDATVRASGSAPAALFSSYLPKAYLDTLPPAGPARLTARLDQGSALLLAPLVSADTLAQIQGRLAGSLTLEADRLTLDSLRGDLVLDVGDVAVGGVSLAERRPTRIVLAGGVARIADFEWSGVRDTVALSGTVQVQPDPVFDLRLTSEIDLRALRAFAPAIATGGRASVALDLRGTVREPDFAGRIDVSDGQLRTSDPRIVVSELAGTILFTPGTMTTTGLSGTANGGPITVSGGFEYEGFDVRAGALTLAGRSLAADVRGLRAEIDTDLTLERTGKGWRLAGTVTAQRGSYREPLTLTSGLLAGLLRQSVSVVEASPPALEAVALDVGARTASDLLVDNNYAELALGADLRVVGSLARPSLLGRAEVREGGQIFLGGVTYRIEDTGVITFDNSDRIEPDLNVTAVTRVQGRDENYNPTYEVRLKLSGTPVDLQPTLTSDPPLPEGDIVSLLMTGRTLSQASSEQSLAGAQVLSYLSGDVLGVAGRAIGLDALRFDRNLEDVRLSADLVATDEDPSSRLTFAKNISSDLQVTFSQSLKESGGFTWIVAYLTTRRIELRVVSLDDFDRWYQVRHTVALGGPAAATERRQTAPPPRVVAVRFTGQPGASDEELLGRLRLRPGRPFDFFRWQDDHDRLEAWFHGRGYLDARVTARRGEDASGITLVYEIQRGPRTILTITGANLSPATVDALKRAWTESVFDQFLLDEMRTRVRRDLASQGYLSPQVTAEVVSRPEHDEKRIRIDIDRGRQTTSRRIDLMGNARLDDETLTRAIEESGTATTAWLDPRPLEQTLRARYAREGMLEADVRASAVLFQDDTAVLPVEISEGPIVRVGEIDFEVAGGKDESEAREAFGLQIGDVYVQSRAEAARARLIDAYHRDGYNKAQVIAAANLDRDRALVSLSVTVDAGPRQVLQAVQTTGARHTASSVVDNALSLETGTPVDLTEWSRARKRLYDTGLFRRVELEPEPMEEAAAEQTADVEPLTARVRLEEWPPVRLRYGLQVTDAAAPAGESRQFGLGVAADLTHRNLFGRAVSAGVSFQMDADARAERVFLSFPRFFGTPLRSNLFASQSREEFRGSTDAFLTDTIDLTAEQRFEVGRTLGIAYGYNFERNHTFDPQPDPGDLIPYDVLVDVARLRATALVDSRDDLLNATRGTFHSSSIEYASEPLGSDVRFVKYLLQQNYYRPLGSGLMVATAGRLGLAKGSGQDLIPSERFYAGGGTSVRGYATDVLGPQDFFGIPTGGNALLVLNEELRFPLFTIFSGVGFFDAGNVFASVGDLSLSDLATSVGLGVRVATPFALIRFDYGVPLNPSPDLPPSTWRTRWFFSLGQAF
jgi:outer membrane protein assembly complex protein YaeT